MTEEEREKVRRNEWGLNYEDANKTGQYLIVGYENGIPLTKKGNEHITPDTPSTFDNTGFVTTGDDSGRDLTSSVLTPDQLTKISDDASSLAIRKANEVMNKKAAEVDSKLAGYVKTSELNNKLNSYVTGDDLTNKLNTVATKRELSAYATNDAVETKLRTYVNNDNLTEKLSGYSKSTDVDTKLNNYVTTNKLNYNVSEIETSLSNKPETYETIIGDGRLEYTVNHGLNNKNVIVTLRENSSPFGIVYMQTEILDENNVKLAADEPITANDQVSVLIVGKHK